MALRSERHPHPAIREAVELLKTISERVDADLLVCDRCGHWMVVRSAQTTRDPIKLDIRIKCPSDEGCGWWTTHGIGSPWTLEDYRRWEDEFGTHVDAVTTEPSEDDGDEVKERLSALGYLDM